MYKIHRGITGLWTLSTPLEKDKWSIQEISSDINVIFEAIKEIEKDKMDDMDFDNHDCRQESCPVCLKVVGEAPYFRD